MSVGDDDPVAASASGGFADRLHSVRPSGPKSKRTCPKRIFPVSALDNRRKARADELQLEDRWYPIQPETREYRLQYYEAEAPVGDFTAIASVSVAP